MLMLLVRCGVNKVRLSLLGSRAASLLLIGQRSLKEPHQSHHELRILLLSENLLLLFQAIDQGLDKLSLLFQRGQLLPLDVFQALRLHTSQQTMNYNYVSLLQRERGDLLCKGLRVAQVRSAFHLSASALTVQVSGSGLSASCRNGGSSSASAAGFLLPWGVGLLDSVPAVGSLRPLLPLLPSEALMPVLVLPHRTSRPAAVVLPVG